jgi:ABC-type spermidine/putrescine transport system permease subunit I
MSQAFFQAAPSPARFATQSGLAWLLLLPGVLIIAGFLFVPIALMAVESFRPYVAGSVQVAQGWTLANYRELLTSAYAFYFWDTFRIGFLVSLISLGPAAILAWTAARSKGRLVRVAIVNILIALLFLSLIARLYAILLTWGSTGVLSGFGAFIGVPASSAAYAEVQVMLGLMHLVIPISALMLIGTFQNLNPRLEEASASLGAPNWRVALDVTFPLALPGLLSAFMLAFAVCISNFVAPLILGRGIVLFTTNLIYTRFSDIGNYPSGAAIGILTLGLAFATLAILNIVANRLSAETGRA